MGYPQASVTSTPPPQPSETVTSVLAQAFDRLIEIEGKLCNIRDRIDARSEQLEKGLVTPQHPGTLHLSMDIRTATMRLLDRCSEIDALL